jgi:hypothetical protein
VGDAAEIDGDSVAVEGSYADEDNAGRELGNFSVPFSVQIEFSLDSAANRVFAVVLFLGSRRCKASDRHAEPVKNSEHAVIIWFWRI